MKKISSFLVNYRYLVMGIMLVLTIAFGLMIPKVNINDDMASYLPESSNMKQGMNIMEEEFPDLTAFNVIRIMFTNLEESEKEPIKEELESIPYVDSVAFEKDDSDYNRENYTLYEISTESDFDSEEEQSIRETIAEKYQDYDLTIEQQDNTRVNLPAYIIIFLIIVLLGILFTMSGSWFEPAIFLIVIGLAILLNMGTNILKDSVSQTTFAIAAILQLVLSMDYSVILMNRFKQERKRTDNPKEAMKLALSNSCSSIVSSALTTFVGLLMLLFMSFKIGADLGAVLAKGVVCSLLYVFTVLPALTLLFEPIILKTEKKIPVIPVKGLAKAEYKARFVLTPFFVVLFIVAYILQSKTAISFALDKNSPIDDIFPPTNSTVLLYANEDGDRAQVIADALEEDENVKSVISYDTFFAKQRTTEEMKTTIEDLGADMTLEPYMLRLMYYKYHNGDNLPGIRMADLLNFIANDVMTNEEFKKQMSGDVAENIDMIRKFASKETLTRKMSIKELADFFDMKTDDVKQMFVLYYSKYQGGSMDNMIIKQFVDFLSKDIMTDSQYASYITTDMKSQISTFKKFADKATVTTPYSYHKTAEILGMDADQMKLLYTYYYAQKDSYDPGTMTLPELVTFLNEDVASDPTFASFIDEKTREQLKMLAVYTDAEIISTPLDAQSMGTMLGMTSEQVDSIYCMYYGAQKAQSTKLTLDAFLTFLLQNETITSAMSKEELEQLKQMNTLARLVKAGTPLPAENMGMVLQMDTQTVTALYQMYGASIGNPGIKYVPLYDFVEFIVTKLMNDSTYKELFDEKTKESLTQMYQLQSVVKAGKEFSYSEMAKLLQMEQDETYQVYVLYAGSMVKDKTMTPYDMVSFILSDKSISSQLDEEALAQLEMLKQLMDVTLSGEKLSYKEMSRILGMDEATMKMMYTLKASRGDISSWKISIKGIVDFILKNEATFGSMIGDNLDSLKTLSKIIDGVASDKAYGYQELAVLLGMNSKDMKQMFLLYTSKYGNTSNWGVSPVRFVDFVLNDILTNKDYASKFDKESEKQLKSARKIMYAVISDKEYTVDEATELMKGMSDELDQGTMRLLYTFYGSEKLFDSTLTMSIEEMFNFLHDDLLQDPDFKDMIDEESQQEIRDMKGTLDDAIKSLKGENYSMMSIATQYPKESPETTRFMALLYGLCDQELSEDHYLIGSSPMYYEMSLDFKGEMLLMTLLTAIAIFIIVLLTFRRFIIPTLLVLLIQCAVFVTVSFSYMRGYAINYLAFLIVQCVLMGATIDYAILFTNNYIESRLYRKENGIQSSLHYAYSSSLHTILTSGLIMILVTGIIGTISDDPSIGPICITISLGCLSAVTLIIFLLPGMLALMDRLFVPAIRRRKGVRRDDSR